MLFRSFAIIDPEHAVKSGSFTRLALRFIAFIGAGLFAILFLGCGGGGSSGTPQPGGPPSGPPQFTIASANWVVDLIPAGGSSSPSPFAGGLLTQSGSNVSGILHVSGSPCFDPVADALTVHGAVSSDPNAAQALTLTTSPVHGQTLSLSATWDNSLDPGAPPTSPPNPVKALAGNWTITGGSCAATGGAGAHTANFSGTWSGTIVGPTWAGHLIAVMSQTGPDAQGFSQVSGTFSVTGSPCFTSGTIVNTTFAGDIGQMNVTMDSGALTGSARTSFGLNAGASFVIVTLNLVVHGGSCDGQPVTFSSFPP